MGKILASQIFQWTKIWWLIWLAGLAEVCTTNVTKQFSYFHGTGLHSKWHKKHKTLQRYMQSFI